MTKRQQDPGQPEAPSATVSAALQDKLDQAMAAAKKGDLLAVAECLRAMGLPPELADMLPMATAEHARLKRLIEADPGDPGALEMERNMLMRAHPGTAADAKQIADRLLELEVEIGRATSAHALAGDARGRLATLIRFFPGLFDVSPEGLDGQWGGLLPPTILAAVRRYPYPDNPQHWLDLEQREPPLQKRKVRVAGVFGFSSR